MMIDSARIHNFQSHSDSVLEFSPGINTLVGDSDCGKSAVMRAILWCITNQPQGDAHISDWCKTPKGKMKAQESCSVEVRSNPGPGMSDVTRKRSADFNGYLVYQGGDSEDTYEALRADVPAEVASCFNIGPVNIQRQMDSPFLVSMSAGEAARYINSLVDLSDIDSALSEVNSMSRETAQDTRAAHAEVESLQKDAAALEWVDRLQELSREVSGLDDRMAVTRTRQASAVTNLQAHRAASARAQAIQEALDAASIPLRRARELSGRMDRTIARLNRLEASLRDWKAASARLRGLEGIGRLQECLDRARDAQDRQGAARRKVAAGSLVAYAQAARKASIDLEGLDRMLPRLARMRGNMEGSRSGILAMKASLSDWSANMQRVSRVAGEMEALQESLHGQVCPVCGQPLDHCLDVSNK